MYIYIYIYIHFRTIFRCLFPINSFKTANLSVKRPVVENGLNLHHHSFDHTCGITSKVRVAQMLNELDG